METKRRNDDNSLPSRMKSAYLLSFAKSIAKSDTTRTTEKIEEQRVLPNERDARVCGCTGKRCRRVYHASGVIWIVRCGVPLLWGTLGSQFVIATVPLSASALGHQIHHTTNKTSSQKQDGLGWRGQIMIPTKQSLLRRQWRFPHDYLYSINKERDPRY